MQVDEDENANLITLGTRRAAAAPAAADAVTGAHMLHI